MPNPDFTNATWRKSSRSMGQTDQCVELAAASGHIGIRDSKHPALPALVITGDAWGALRTALRRR